MSKYHIVGNHVSRLIIMLFVVTIVCMRGSRKFCQRGSNFSLLLLFYKGYEDLYSTKSGPMMTQHDGPTLNAGLVFRGCGPVLVGNPIFFMIFQRVGVWTHCPPSGSAHGVCFLFVWSLLCEVVLTVLHNFMRGSTLKNRKNIGFLSNTGPDPFKIIKLSSQIQYRAVIEPLIQAYSESRHQITSFIYSIDTT